MALKSFNGKERRAYVRLENSLPVKFKISAEQKSKTYTAMTKNISRGGLCLEIDRNIQQLFENLSGTDLKISIDLDTLIPQPETAPPAKAAWISSRVDWARKPTAKNPAMLLGLEFEGVSDDARRRIHGYIVEAFVKRYEENE